MKFIEKSDSSKNFSKAVFETLSTAYRPYFTGIIIVLIGGFVGRILILGQANIIGYWVDSLCKTPTPCPSHAFFTGWNHNHFLSLLAFMGIAGFALTSIFRVLFSRYSAYAVSSIYDWVTFKTSRFPIRFFDENPAGRIITRFSSDYGTVFRLFGGPLAEFISIIFDLICILILIITSSFYFAIPLVIIIFLNFVIYKKNIHKLRHERRALSASRSPSISHFAESTQGSTTIKISGRSETFRERFQFLDSFYNNQRLKTNVEIIKFSLQMNNLSSLLLLLVGLMSFYLIRDGRISAGAIGASFGLIVYSGNTIQMFFEWLSQLEEGIIGVERLSQYLNKDLEHGQKNDYLNQLPELIRSPQLLSRLSSPHILASQHQQGDLVLDNLWFRYSTELPWVLKGISLKINHGEKIGIIGRTGSGKTSLIQSLFILYPYEKGHIRLNGQEPIHDIDLTIYRSHFSYISQDPVLFQGSLRENLDPLKLMSSQSILQTLVQVGYIASVQDTAVLDSRIEERGKNLSVGEKQLLCLARTLLQKSPFVILDEATSSVDPQSEELMVRATEEFFSDRTVLIIAHRLSTLEKCDRIVWLEKGEIRKIGPAEEVIREFKKFEEASPT
ncbi:MAG: ATP-binding cassette domain-containing protein [Bdellovibrionaceae bacterium]|nr:ATP-binding cassette domain-containing protein [Pseudobdellovibrionaceae bacterium]